MIRQAAVVAIAVCLAPAWVSAQTTTQFTVSVQSAAVRKSPSTASPVIGQAPRGMVLDVTRDIGAWVKVAWPDAQDGIGYVHHTMGSLSRRTTLEERVAVAMEAVAAADPGPAAALAPAAGVTDGPAPVPMPPRTQYVTTPTHFVGVGARMGRPANDDFGITARVWSRSRLGVQIDASRSTLLSDQAAGRVTSRQFTPSVIYSLPDSVSDYLWLRPYRRRRRRHRSVEAHIRHAGRRRCADRDERRLPRVRRRRAHVPLHRAIRDQRGRRLSLVA